MAGPQSLLVELKGHVDSGDVDAGLSTLSKIKVSNVIVAERNAGLAHSLSHTPLSSSFS